MKMKPLIYVMLSALLLSAPAAAKHWHDDDDHDREHGRRHGDDDRRCYFQERDMRIINEYYAPRYRSLPPGLEKKYYRTGQLPRGWQRRMAPLPLVVERQLVPVPAGYRRGLIDGYVYVDNPSTQIVIDVVAVFGRR
jgi:hypothetical protein